MSQPDAPQALEPFRGTYERIEEYATIIQDAAWLNERRQTNHNIFIGINTLALTGIGYVLMTNKLSTWWAFYLTCGVALTLLPINLIWQRSLLFYKRGLDSRYEYLRQIENTFPRLTEQYTGVYNKFVFEKISRYSNSIQERRIAFYFSLLGPLLSAIVGVATWLITNHVVPSPY